MKKILTLLVVAIAALFVFTGCGNEKTADKSKPVVIGQTSVVGAIEPTAGGTPWALTSSGISETVFRLNDKGELVSRYVKEVKKVDNNTWELTLNQGVKFSDGKEIDADAFCWALNTIMKDNKLSNATAGVIKFTKEDKYKVKAVTERPTQNMKSVLAEWTNILFKKGDKGYIFSGPYTIKKFEPKVSLDLMPNQNYDNHDKRGEVIVKAFKDVTALKMAFQSGELDVAFGITPEQAKELKADKKIVKKIDAGYQYFGIVNMNSLIMADPTVRQALDLGLNREDYIKALQGGHVANGLFAQYFPFQGNVKLTYDVEKAKQVLENDGWKLNDKGIREKQGTPLSLRIVTYNSRPDLKIIMQVMVTQLKALGIEAQTRIVDNIGKEAKTDNFDIILYAQHTAPTGDPAYFLNQFFRTNGPKNMMHFSDKKVDAMLDELGNMPFGKDSIAKAQEIQKQIHADLPVLFLVDPQWNVALSERLKDYKIYSGDYYIVNPNLFVK